MSRTCESCAACLFDQDPFIRKLGMHIRFAGCAKSPKKDDGTPKFFAATMRSIDKPEDGFCGQNAALWEPLASAAE